MFIQKLKITVSIALAIILTSEITYGQNNPKREFRGAWIHTVGNQVIKTLDKEGVQKLLIKNLDSLEATGCNAVIFQVRPQADAFYKSDIEPSSRFLSGIQGIAPSQDWDPLEFIIEESHKRGMELHAWCNPYRVTSNDKERLSPDHLFFKHPEIFRRYGKQLYFDPGEPLSIAHTVKVIADITTRYDIDAIHFDDYFYPYPEKFEEFHDDFSFAKYSQEQGFQYWEKNDWRRNNVSRLIRELNDTIKSIKPWVRFGISPFGIHRNLKDTPDGSGSKTNGLSNYEQLFADTILWAEEGSIDYVAPQLYWIIGHPVADYLTLIKWWDKQNLKAQIYIGQNISVLDKQLQEKMDLSRDLKEIDGNIWWPGWSITNNINKIADSLSSTYQNRPALIPAYTNIDDIAPKAISTIEKFGNTIKWEVCETDDIMQKPHFFAVYLFENGEKIDISSSKNLHKLVRDKNIDISDKSIFKVGMNCVITTIDKCWNESEASNPILL